ncbi:hypothetical protein Hbor_08840 [Halogeometricum borinquense DSM 11551]|uniref:Uncharacterized protein n=1 Tax=Halogeometricum borinquense (strain ATCC 700274 / DSM 11551 / JCM 10706 / KCTC 4070 / PR3) TaxID=469382 RepID=E4NPC5_HALBP|nr:hypothetical protein Hbor_08840 [Halogeometricum borinquense DSM 11551]
MIVPEEKCANVQYQKRRKYRRLPTLETAVQERQIEKRKSNCYPERDKPNRIRDQFQSEADSVR